MDPRAIVAKLVRDGALGPEKLASGEEIAEGAGLPLVRVLLHMKLVDAAAVAKAIAVVGRRQVLNLDRWVSPSPIPSFTEGLCRELRVFPLAFEEGDEGRGQRLVLGMADPSDADAGVKVAALIGKDVRSVLVDDTALTRAIARRYTAPVEPKTELVLVEELELKPEDELEEDIEKNASMFEDDEATAAGGFKVPVHDDGIDESEEDDDDEDGDIDLTSIARAAVQQVSLERAVKAASDDLDIEVEVRDTTEGEPVADRSDGDVFASVDAATVLVPSGTHHKFVRDTVLAASPFLQPGRTSNDLTDVGGLLGKMRVVVVSVEADARLRIAADLAPFVREAIVVDDLQKAERAAKNGALDEIVVHDPKNDVATGVLLDRLARAARRPVVVISDDESFDALPCVRRRLPLPDLASALAPLILEALFER